MKPIIFEDANGARMTFNNPRLLTIDVVSELRSLGYECIDKGDWI